MSLAYLRLRTDSSVSKVESLVESLSDCKPVIWLICVHDSFAAHQLGKLGRTASLYGDGLFCWSDTDRSSFSYRLARRPVHDRRLRDGKLVIVCTLTKLLDVVPASVLMRSVLGRRDLRNEAMDCLREVQ